MATMTKTNGIAKRGTATVKKEVQKKLAEQATGKTSVQPVKPNPITPMVQLAERIQGFEKLRGLADQRERLRNTLTDIQRFNYNNDGASTFFMRDSSGKEFKTTNSNLIKLVAEKLQTTLEARKKELETEILAFEL